MKEKQSIVSKICCFLGFHYWYHGTFQTGKISKWTGDPCGVIGRVCLNCGKKQKSGKNNYITVKSFEDEKNR